LLRQELASRLTCIMSTAHISCRRNRSTAFEAFIVIGVSHDARLPLQVLGKDTGLAGSRHRRPAPLQRAGRNQRQEWKAQSQAGSCNSFIFLVVENVSLDGSCKTAVGIRSSDVIRLPLLGIRISHGNRSADLAEHREIILHIAQRRDRHGWNNEPSEEGVDEGSFIKVGRVISR
jgi:hypothetical protein